MKRENLETYIGIFVTIALFDGDSFTGLLKKGTGHERNYYQCSGSCWFRCSHVTKLIVPGSKKAQLDISTHSVNK